MPNTQTAFFNVPEEYVGKEIEVIAFTKNEGLQNIELPKKLATFSALSIDTRGFKFNRRKPMSGKVFLDTNILVYTYSNSEPVKQTTARNLVTNSYSFISTQVLQELVNTVTRKFKFSYADAIQAIDECCAGNFLHTNTPDTLKRACIIAQR